jgi:hypothetical protein
VLRCHYWECKNTKIHFHSTSKNLGEFGLHIVWWTMCSRRLHNCFWLCPYEMGIWISNWMSIPSKSLSSLKTKIKSNKSLDFLLLCTWYKGLKFEMSNFRWSCKKQCELHLDVFFHYCMFEAKTLTLFVKGLSRNWSPTKANSKSKTLPPS